MKRVLCFLCVLALAFPCMPVRTTSAATALTEKDIIGIMPEGYVGTLTMEGVNTVEDTFASENAFPTQGIALLPDGDLAVCDTGYGRVHILSADLQPKTVVGSLGSGRGQLQYPADVAADASGALYVADFFNNKVVKYTVDGSVLLEFGSEGTGAGQFEGAAGIAVTDDGTIWVADQLNNRIEQFSAAGKYLTAITGIKHPSGMTSRGMTAYVAAEGGSVYAITGTRTTRLFTASGEDESLITSAADLAVDAAGNIYIADRGTGTTPFPAIKVFSPSGTYQRSYGQYPSDLQDVQDEELLSPGGVAVAGSGTVYVMNSGYFRDATNPFGCGFHAKLVRYAATGGVTAVQEFAVDAPGRLNNPQSIAVDDRGQLWVGCSAPAVSEDGGAIQWNRGELQVLDGNGNCVRTLTEVAGRPLQVVESLAAGGNGLIYVGAEDADGSFIAIFDDQGMCRRTITSDAIDTPGGIAPAADGTVWVGNQGNNTVVHLTATGQLLKQFTTDGMPGGLRLLKNGDLLVCVWGDLQQVVDYTPAGIARQTYGTSGGGRGTGQMYYPYDAVQLPDGLILVSDAENGRFTAFQPDGSLAWTTQRSWYVPAKMAWSSRGTLYVADPLHNVIREFSYGSSAEASYIARFDTPAQTAVPGTDVSFRLMVHNTRSQAGTFSLQATGTAGWTVTVTPASVSLAAGQTSSVAVTVAVPAGLAAGVTGMATVTVESAGTTLTTVRAQATTLQALPAVVGGTSAEVADTPGMTVTIPVMVRGAEALYGAGCTVNYDAGVLQLTAVTAGTLFGPDALLLENHATSGKIQLGVSLTGEAAGVSGDGSLAVLTFRLLAARLTELDVNALALYGAAGGTTLPGKAYAIPVTVTSPQETQGTTILLRIGSATITVNGTVSALDVAPMIFQNRTFVPARAIVEALGGSVDWNAASRTVTVKLGTRTIVMVAGKGTATLNGATVPIDASDAKVTPQIVNGRLLLPVRFVATALGAQVAWDNATSTVTITQPAP